MSLSISFTGDISFSGIFAEESTVDFLDPQIITFLRNSDYNVFNIEGALTTCENIPKLGVSLTSHPSRVDMFRNFPGVIFNLANNHIMDAGAAGLKETRFIAQNLNIQTLGAGMNLDEASRPLVLEKDNIKVSLIAVCHPEGSLATAERPGIFCDKQEEKLLDIIGECKEKTDWVVLNYHGGEEFSYVPMPSRRRKFLKYLESGVDIIVAHHAHVVQGIEKKGGGMVFFSLGNFIFDIPGHLSFEGTEESVLIRIGFEKEKFTFEKIFTSINRETGVINILGNNTKFLEFEEPQYQGLWANECRRVIKRQYYNSMSNKIVNSNRYLGFLNQVPRKFQNPLRYLKFIYFSLRLSNPYQRAFLAGTIKDLICRFGRKAEHDQKKDDANDLHKS
ncbi:CapA family protein [Candidatus Woesearchaeota archaeon]|nr:CapA family protein [Candidatus Woesearchaeota archaeon]